MRKGTTKIPFNALLKWENGNLGVFLLGLFYLIFPWLTSGVLNETIAIFGLMFVTIAVMRAKGSNTVVGGLCQGFIGVVYICAIGGLIGMTTLWAMAIILAAIFFVLEMGFFKFGPTTKKADVFQIVPLTLMTFALGMAIAGQSTTLFIIDWSNITVALNYVAIFLFCAVSMLQLAGWNIAGKNTNKYTMLFAVAAIALAIFGTYQGTLWQYA